jgi:membrane protease YdiL (CAAX protease family)
VTTTERSGDGTDCAPVFPSLWQAFLLSLAIPGVQLVEKGGVLATDALFNTSYQREPMTVLVTSLISVPLVALTASRCVPSSPLHARPNRNFVRGTVAVLGCLAMASGMAFAALAYFQWVGSFMPTLETWGRFRGFTTRKAAPIEGLLVFALPPLILPTFEEWLFRGIILRGLFRRFGPFAAVAFAAALFSLAHAEMGGALVAFVSSLMWGWWYFKTRSLGLCIMGHTAQNAVSIGTCILFRGDLDAVPSARCALWGGVMLATGFCLCWAVFPNPETTLEAETVPADIATPL